MAGEAGTTARRPWVWPAVASLVGLLVVAYLYRKFLVSGFEMFQGDVGDGRFTALIASHWAAPFQFGGGLTDLGFFYPVGGGLGYSDGMLAFGVVVAPLMWLGMGALPAFQWTLISFTVIGYASTIAFLRQGPGSPWPLAIVAGVLVNASNGLMLASGHAQLRAFSLCPVVLLCVLHAVRAPSRGRRVAWGFAAGLLLGLITYSAFYVGWFVVLGASVTVVILVVLLLVRGELRPSWPRLAWAGGAGLAGFAVMVPLLLVTYLPVAGQPRILENVLFYALQPSELTNVSVANVLWGRILVAPQGDEVRLGEWMMAPTPLLVVVTLAVAVAAFVGWRHLNRWSVLGLATVLAGVVVWLLPVDVNGVAPWRAVFLIPGASAIRAIGRIEILAGSMFALGLVILLTQWWRSPKGSARARTVVTLLMLVLAFEQLNSRPGQSVSWEKVVAVESVAKPPAECASFVLLPPFDPARPGYEYAIDAVQMARITGLPTWNGYSGDWPPGWNVLTDRPDYLEQVRSWQALHGIEDACGFRPADGTWLTPDLLDVAIAG